MEGTRTGWQIFSPALPTHGTNKRQDGERRRQPPSRRQKVTRSQSVSPVGKTNKPGEVKQSPENNARERYRVRTLRQAFLSLQAALPSVPPDTKLSKLDVLVLATSYIAHLTHTLDQERHLLGSCQVGRGPGYLHPMKKWPMRARLYAETLECELSAGRPSHKN